MSADPPDEASVDATVTGKPAARRAPTLERGSSIGRYLLLDELGKGGMGVVYKAYDPELDRPIALKLLLTDDKGESPQRDRLLREAQALAKLAHPNVLAVHDVGTFRGDVFIAMEFVEGKTLRRWLKDAPRTQKQILEVFLAAGDGLAAAHRAGLVHRDFKPDNVMIGEDGRVRVLDFGLARSAQASTVEAAPSTTSAPELPSLAADAPTPLPSGDESMPTQGEKRSARMATVTPTTPSALSAAALTPSSHSSQNLLSTPLTHVGAIVGTPRFMAPEQHLAEATDARADQFSFCVSLYWALYGDFPFVGPTLELMLDQLLAGRVASVPAGATVPRWMRQVLLRGLSRRPDDRFPTMEALLTALRADPRVGRRRWLSAASLLLVAGSIGLTVRAVSQRELRACQSGVERLAGVWDEPRRQAVREAFRKSKTPYAEAALAAVEHAFDGYAKAWAAMHVDACEATHVRKEQSQELLDLRMSCLDERRASLKTLAEIYANADESVIKHAAQSSQGLPDLATCADTAALKAPMPPPRDPQTRARVAEVKLELARVHALTLAAKFDEGLKRARAAVAQADQLGYLPLEADAQLQLGEVASDRGDDYNQSLQAMQRALVLALEGHHDETAASAATELIDEIGVHKAHYEEAERWAELALALVDRVPHHDRRLAMFYVKRSGLYRAESKYDQALADAKHALEIQQKTLPPDHLDLGTTWDALGQIQFYLAHHQEALDAYQHALAIKQKTLGPNHPLIAGVMIGIADVYGDMGDHERALAEYRQALDFLLRVQPDHSDVAVTRNNMGLELLALERPKEAFELFQQALDEWQRRIGPSVEVVLALGNQGFAKVDMHEPAEALRYFNRAIAVAEKVLGPSHAEYARVLAGAADAYRKLGQLDEAVRYYQKAMAVDEKALGPKHPHLIDELKGISQVEVARHQPARARPLLERALAIAESQPDPAQLADVLFLDAQVLWATGEEKRAVELGVRARDAFAKAGAAVKDNLAEVSSWLAAPARQHYRSMWTN